VELTWEARVNLHNSWFRDGTLFRKGEGTCRRAEKGGVTRRKPLEIRVEERGGEIHPTNRRSEAHFVFLGAGPRSSLSSESVPGSSNARVWREVALR